MRLPPRVVTSLLFAILLPLSTALAIGPPAPAENAILGLYTTPTFGETTANRVTADLGERVVVYAVLSYPLFGGVGGVEFTIATDPPGAFGTILALGETKLEQGALMMTTAPDYVIGYALPLFSSTDHRVVVAQAFTVLSRVPVSLELQPYARPSLPGAMAYNDWFDPGDLRPMLPNSADHGHDMPVFGVNRDLVATEGVTWGAVKALFD
jgi:hypothetical protein